MTNHDLEACQQVYQENAETFYRDIYGQPNETFRNTLANQIGSSLLQHMRLLDRYGITTIRGILDADQASEIQEDIEHWSSTKGWDNYGQMGFDGGGSGRAYLPTSRALSEAVTNPTIMTLAAAALGQHPTMASVSTYRINPRPENQSAPFPFAWHHDGLGPFGYRAMILLSDVSEDGQAMRFCPGTHLLEWPTNSMRDVHIDSEIASRYGEYVCSGKAGDVIIFNPHALHRGTRNNSKRRDATIVYFQPGHLRNHPLPGLHPEVVDRLSPYQNRVYRIGEAFTLPNEHTLPSDLLRHRADMDQLAVQWLLPAKTIREDLVEVDKRIEVIGAMNSLELPHKNENIPQEDRRIDTFRRALSCDLAALAAIELTTPTLSELRSTWISDFNNPLDLPIRMFHPTRDQYRDWALISIRNAVSPYPDTVLQELEEAIANIDMSIARDSSDFTDTMDASLNAAAVLSQEWEADTSTLQQYLYFAEDLQSMLSKADSTPFLRRSLLFSWLTLRTLYGLASEQFSMSHSVIKQLGEQKDHTLGLYTYMNLLNSGNIVKN